ncbi:sigma-54-dependent transcriptional regulator [Singulisphaera acidiphila]|uniref:DNA-binding transcriptional regulator NtrC n=1 Tax=Singulisphaera acidiphila (strain ATCC BAA-1392 / DSM 18658 / VKM B-2454 / MOB10) TaxID=886293 RepID=L0D8V2_SINAD|nr:sigma-54 dependent transcriptional regulator [Singulisphaera acidiphila]AGA25667.1 response regulator with CheY-like receiver, AAA-type ATPase, and DNA-binding domains [Singulisphaera acidiphila DSM 18658]
MATILVIDDELSILHAFRRAFDDPADTLLTASDGAEGLEIVTQSRPDVVVLDLNLPDMFGLDVFQHIRQIDARIPVIFITGQGTTETAIEAMKLGAFDYLLKPLDVGRVREQVERAAEIGRLMRVPAVVTDEVLAQAPADVIVGRSPAMQEVYKAIGLVAPQDLAVLILGDSGTGKELVARAVYQHSRRATGPFLAINCAAIPETLLESELFGHEKGAFTGADRKRIGKFEQCSGGTLFLDEIGDMTPLTQAKILRVLQDGRFERVGGNETIRTDVRIIAATNRDLGQMVASGEFRGDLYYRLGIVTIRVPALRERADDLPLLVEHFLKRFSPELGKKVDRISPEAMDVLRRHPWPGNIRELQSVLKQALLRAQGPVLVADFLPPSLRGEEEPAGSAAAPMDWEGFLEDRLREGSHDLYAEALALMERSLVTRVLRHTGGNQLQAAKLLGITRGSLRTKIRTLGIRIDRSVWSGDDQTGQ